MTSDIFDQEAATLAKFKQLKEKNEWSGDDFGDLINHYGKLLRTTKRIIKLSDKNEQRLNQLKTEAQDTNEQFRRDAHKDPRWNTPEQDSHPLTRHLPLTGRTPTPRGTKG